MNKDDNLAGAARYYASPQEQKILVHGLIRYFSLPERSQNRNKIVKEVASYLSMLSPHWSHRAVRLWFNNNRHTYLPVMNEQRQAHQNATNQTGNQEFQRMNDKISPIPSMNSNLNLNQNPGSSLNMNMTNAMPPFQQQGMIQPSMPIDAKGSLNQQNLQMFPIKNTENMQATNFFNPAQMGQNLQIQQQQTAPFTNQFFSNSGGFMPQFQFGMQQSMHPSIQVNTPIQFNQQAQFSQPQTMAKPFSSPQMKISQNAAKIKSSMQQSMQTQNPQKLQQTIKPTIKNPSINFSPNPEQKAASSVSDSNSQNGNDFFQIKSPSILSSNGSGFSNFGSSNQGQFYFQPQKQQLMNEQSYISISAMLNEIRKLSQDEKKMDDPRLSQLISEFDRKCMQVAAQFGPIQPEKIEPMVDYVTFKFPSPAEDSNLGVNVFPYSTSANDFSEISDHSITFGGQETNVWDQLTPNSIWQQRPFIDETLTYFENCLLTDDYFAYTSLQLGSTQRTLSLKKYRQNNQLNSFKIETESQIDSFCINSDVSFLLSKKNVIKIALLESKPQVTISLDSIMKGSSLSVSEGLINPFGENSAIISFSNVPTIFFINKDASLSYTTTDFSGFINISSFGVNNDAILVCPSNSPTIRLISPDGREISSFVGHLGQVMNVEPIADDLFASCSEDKTVRIWDYRSPRMITTITTPNVSTLCMTGSRNFVICGFSNKNITVTDLRREHGKPLLGVSTQDYNAIMLKYHPDDDSLMMFGQIEKDTTKDSMIFVDHDGHSRKSILRHYSNFARS